MSESVVPQRQLPRYKCHKEVWALKIAAIEINKDGSASIFPKDEGYAMFTADADWVSRFKPENDDDAGYYVVYQDGYKSWSPTKAFENGYTKI